MSQPSPLYPTAAALPRERRPQHTQCPSCRAGVRVGWAQGVPVVGQHWRPTHPGPTSEGHHGDCCPCPGSYSPVRPEDCWDFLQDTALTATGSLRAVPPATGSTR